jgi:hypothetical protein
MTASALVAIALRLANGLAVLITIDIAHRSLRR